MRYQHSKEVIELRQKHQKTAIRSKMARICMVGDSNIYRHVSEASLSTKCGGAVTLLQCTKEVTFDCYLDGLKKGSHQVIIISVLSNFICQLGAQDLETNLAALYERFCAKLYAVPGKIVVVPPLLRYEPSWFRDHFPMIQLGLQEATKSMKDVLLLSEFKVTESDLETDQVHLNKAAGERFFNYFVSALQDLDANGLVSAPAETLSSSDEVLLLIKNQVLPQLEGVPKVERGLTRLRKQVQDRFARDDVMFSKMREEMDYKANLSKADRVVFINVAGDSVPDKLSDYKAKLSNLIRPVVTPVLPGAAYDVLPRRGGLKNGFYPPFEVRFASAQATTTFRRQAKVREHAGFEKVILAPSVTLATRVRFEVLKAICVKLRDPASRGYTPMFSLRPLLHLGPEVNGKVVPRSTLLYTDAIERFGHLLKDEDLSVAYARAGTFFKGLMRQHFVVLSDPEPGEASKRRRSDETASASVSKKGRATETIVASTSN